MANKPTVKLNQKGKKPRTVVFEPLIGDEIIDPVAGLVIVTRRIWDEVSNDLTIVTEPSPNPPV